MVLPKLPPTCPSRVLALCRHVFARSLASTAPKNLKKAGGEDSEADIREGVQKAVLQTGLRFLKGDIAELKQNVANRDSQANIDMLLEMQSKYTSLLKSSELLRHKRNVTSYRIQQQKEKQIEEKGEVGRLKYEGGALKEKIAELESSMEEVLKEMLPELSLIPNYAHPDVPIGSYEASRTVHVHSSKPEFTFSPKEHVEIGESLGVLDFRSASRATGHGFYYLRGAAAMLELALVKLAMQKATARGYTPVITPDIVKADIVAGCGFSPRGASTQVYAVSSHHGDQCLAGTAEIPLAGMFANTVTQLRELPIRLVAFGRSFRAETGGHGHASRGLYRVHQFSKVELFGLTANEREDESENMLNEIVDIQKEIIEELGLHYRLLDMSTAELGAPAYRKYDIEVWMPGRKEFGEVTSASNCTDYQSARLRIRYPNPAHNEFREPGRKYTHTVNGTACAVPRVIVALLENYQQEVRDMSVSRASLSAVFIQDGSVRLPSVLHQFLSPEYCHIKPLT